MNPLLRTLDSLVALERQGKLTGPTAQRVIQLAEQYARRNRLLFDGSLRGALKLVEEAHRTVQDFEDRKRKARMYDGRGIRVMTRKGRVM
jgi:cell division septum initiation protein DivIVA